MRFIITKNIIDNVIASMQPFLEKKDASAITSHIYLEVQNSMLILKATDYEIGLQSQIDDLNESEDGKATVNGSNLLGIIKRLKNSEITFETIDNNLVIKQNKSIFKLPMYDPNEYPELIKDDNLNKIDISTFSFINSIRKITPAVDTTNPKFELNGALIDIKSNNINFVATDTRRLAVAYLENISNKESQFIIPKKAIVEIQKLFVDDATMLFDDTNLVVSNDRMKFFTKLINGKFPDYERIIPKNLKHTLTLPKSSLIESIKLVTSLFSNIKITFTANAIILESLDEDSESQTQIDIDLDLNEDFHLAVNAKYLLDFLSMTNNENIKVGFNESNLPFYLEDEKFSTIVMPIVLEK
ncbi:MAG: DNA polymerase III subunit beta [Campylobacterota bacterium]